MRKLNLFFVAGLLAASLLLGIVVYFVHDYQVQRNARGLLDRAGRSESESKLAQAAESLRNYLSLRPDDPKAWVWYAKVTDDLYAESPRHRGEVLLVHEEALRHNPDDVKLERKCVDLAMEFGIARLADAKRHIETLLAKLPKEPGVSEGGELSELLGDCYSRESNFARAEEAYQEAIRRDPARVSSCFKLAQLARNELRKSPAAADEQIARMVARNPGSGLAYLYRFRYDARFRPPASDSDLKRALELAPDDPDVLQTAAMECEARNLSAAARVHLEKGAKLFPTNLYFITGLANLESREQHPERAEAVLRKAYEQKPSWIFAFELARLLIEQNKIKGEGQAESFLAVLRSRGLGQSFGRMLEAQILMKEGRYGDAIGEIEAAQAIFKSQDSRMNAQLNLMLADCYRHTGEAEKNLAALQNAFQSGAASEANQLELARALIRSDGPGDLDSALRILQSLVGGRPELELDITRLLWQKTMRQPRDQRDWRPVEQGLAKAASSLGSLKKGTESTTALALLRAEVYRSQGDLEKARSVLLSAVAEDPRNPTLKVALARLEQRQEGKGKEALAILDRAEKELGRSMEIELARLAYWEQQGGQEAKAEVPKLASYLEQVPASGRPVYLRRLARTEAHLGLFQSAREHLAQLVSLQPEDRDAVFELFELALQSGEQTEVAGLIDRLYALENPESRRAAKDRRSKGTYWRFAEALDLISQEIGRRQAAEPPSPKSQAASPADSSGLQRACELAGEIEALRPGWWGGPLLSAKIADLSSRIPEAIAGYKRALELGNSRSADLQRLISLLAQLDRSDEIDQVITALRDPEGAPAELKIQTAISAMRRHDFTRGLALANELFAKSNQYADHLSLARFYVAAGDSAGAADQYRRAVELGPGAPETWTSYVSYLVQAKQLDLARAAIESARKALPADRSALPLAACYASIGEVKQAETEIQRALAEKSHGVATALRFAADFALARGRTGEAEKYLSELVGPASGARPEDLAWANRIRAKILVRKGRPGDLDAARGLIGKNLDENPKSPEDNQVLASILAVQAKTRGQAIKILEPLDEQKRLGPSEQFLLAQLYDSERDEKKYEEEMLKILVAGKSANPLFLSHYIAYLIRSKQLDHAGSWLAELKKAAPQSVATLELEAMLLKARNPAGTTLPEVRDLLLERVRTYPDLIGPVASLLGSYGFPAEAEAAYKEFMLRDPGKPERELALANFLAAQTGRVQEALEHLSHALKNCPLEQVAFAALALYDAPSVTESQRKQVEAWVSEASRRRPDLTGLANKLAALWIRQGRYAEAEAVYRRILSGDSDDSEALNNLAWLLALQDQGKAEEAVELINRAIDQQGPLASLVDTKAVVLIRSGRSGDAIEVLKEAAATDERNASVPLHMAWALQIEGKPDEARKAFRKALELGWKPERSDPLERSFMEKLRQELGL